MRQGCIRYSAKEVCLECAPNHYLDGTGYCIQRKRFDNCAEYDPMSDACIVCAVPYVLITKDTSHPFATTYCRLAAIGEYVINCVAYTYSIALSKYVCSKCYNSGLYSDL